MKIKTRILNPILLTGIIVIMFLKNLKFSFF